MDACDRSSERDISLDRYASEGSCASRQHFLIISARLPAVPLRDYLKTRQRRNLLTSEGNLPLTINPSDSPEAWLAFRGRSRHATNSHDEFAFRRRDGGYHDRDERTRIMCIRRNRDHRDHRETTGAERRTRGGWAQERRENRDERKHACSLVPIRLPVDLFKCLTSLADAGVDFIGTRFNKLVCGALARLRIGLIIRLR